MSASLYNTLMIVSFAISGAFLLVAIILFFKLRIKSAMDELSGKKARKQVSEIRKENAETKSRGYVPGIFNSRTDRTTSSLANDGSRRLKKATSQLSEKDKIKKIDDILDEAGGTVVLSKDMIEPELEEGTTVLDVQSQDEGTTILAEDEGTTLLVEEDEGTTLLAEENDIVEKEKKCNVLREITVFEAKEYIEVED